MLTPAEASTAIGAALVPLPVETLALDAATGRILAETVVAERDLPPFDRVAMDGIAIRHAGWVAGIRRFIVDGVVGAGSEPPPTSTSPTPFTWASFCCTRLETASNTWPGVRVFDVSARITTGESDGLALR